MSNAHLTIDPNSKDITDFLMSILAINSTTKNEGRLAIALETYLKARGWFVQLQALDDEPDRYNVLATRTKFIAPGPRFIFNTHLDTVPPYIPPTKTDQEIKGRGSNDAKAQIAAMVFAAHRIIEEVPHLEKDIGLLFVVGEETDHIGMTEANNLDLLPEYMIVGEPTELKFARLQKGALKIVIEAHGKAAHSGYPHMGVSAIEILLDVLHDLRQHQWPADNEMGATTMNIGQISGGQVMNALAESARAGLMFRVTTSTADVIGRVEQIVAGRAHIDHSFGRNEPVPLTEPPSPYESHVVAFNTDLPYFRKREQLKGAFLFGAGSITNAHSKDEFIRIEDLHKAVDVHVDLAVRMLTDAK